MKIALVAFLLLSAASTAIAQSAKVVHSANSSVTMERYSGTTVSTELGYGIKLNKESSLKREWFVVRDAGAPAFIDGDAGVTVNYKPAERSSLGQYQYRIYQYKVTAREPITAFELRMHVLDIFGRLLRTLSATEIVDLPAGSRGFEGTWRLWSENEASEAFASVAYIAQVRTASGRVYEADRAAVFDHVRTVAKKITEADLDPKREGPPK